MSDFTFILGPCVIANPFITPGVQALSGKEVEPAGFVFRKMDPKKKLLITVLGNDGRESHLPLLCFSKHPPEEEIRRRNSLRGII